MRRFSVFLLLAPAVALTLTQTISAQSRPRPTTRLVGRVFDQTRRLVPGVQVFVNRGEVRAATDTDGIFQLDVLPSDSTIGFRRIGYRPLVVRVDPLPPVGDTILVQLEAGVPLEWLRSDRDLDEVEQVTNRRPLHAATAVASAPRAPRETLERRPSCCTAATTGKPDRSARARHLCCIARLVEECLRRGIPHEASPPARRR